MELSEHDLRTLSRMIDELLDLPPAERASWLASVDPEHARLKPLLADVVADPAIVETDDFLARLPTLVVRATGGTDDGGLGPGDAVGPYRLVREIGHGGMASVWLAERSDGLVSRPVALKLPHTWARHARLAERFAREREILATLTHPNIARLYDVGVALGQPYLAMEYVQGVPIVAHCDEARLPVRERVELFLQVLAAVQYAHARLVVHRDIKPSNVLVSSDGEVRLLDFGIAKLLTDGQAHQTELTEAAGRAFTPQYASPEQIRGEPIGTSTDVYALGVVLYELLCGTLPYRLKRDSRGALEEAILGVDPQPPSRAAAASDAAGPARATTSARLARALAGDLDTITLKALRKDPADRYTSAEAFAQDLRRYLAGEPVLARPDSRWYRARKYVRRNLLAVGAVSAVFLALSIGLAIALWQTNVARNEARRAQAVQAFLLDIFRTNSDAQPDPVKARRTTARELLDIGARRVEQALRAVPQAEEEVLGTLADMYGAVGLDDDAANMTRKRVELAKRIYGPDDPRVASALIAYARDIWPTDRHPDVLPVLNEAKAILDAHPRAPADVRASLLVEMSRAHMYGSQEASLRYATQAVELMRASDPESDDLYTGLWLQGWAHYTLGHFDAARRSFEQALDLATRREPAALADVITGRLALAAALQALADVPGAELQFRRALDESRRRNGADHVDTLHVEARLGAFLNATSRRAEGRQIVVDALHKLERQAGVTPNLVVPVRRAYAWSLLRDGRFDEALPLVAADVETDRRLYPATHVLVDALEPYAQALYETGRYDEALAALDEATAMWDALNGPTADPANDDRFLLLKADVLLAKGERAAAKARLAEVRPPAQPFDAPVDEYAVRRRIGLARVLLDEGDAGQASVEAQAALDEIERSPARQYFQPLEADAALRLGQAQLATGDADRALAYLRRALALREANEAPTSPRIAEAQVELAKCLLETGKPDEAATLVRSAKSILVRQRTLATRYAKPAETLEARVASALRGRARL